MDLLTDTYPTAHPLPRHRYLAEEVAARARTLGGHVAVDEDPRFA